MRSLALAGACLSLFLATTPPARAREASGSVPHAVLAEQSRRVATIARVSPSVVCIRDDAHRGGGSGVIIDAEGYGLTNYHVVAGILTTRKGWGGLSDGKLYELEVLGIDPTGDVAMFRLLGRDRFDAAELGDSDAVRVGDSVLAMGNPFMLSQDYTPSVTSGIVTGVHRYQWGVGQNLIYSDCIQVDAAINPGNSGGPLFDAAGRVIGINGRISVNTRGRFNVGFGYAISANQIKRFLPALRAGLLARHGTLGLTVDDAGERASATVQDPERRAARITVSGLVPDGSADRAGIRKGDGLLRVDGAALTSVNRFVSIMGTYPADRCVLLDVERDGAVLRLTPRLDPVEPELPAPFPENRGANLRQTRRVLGEFRDALGLTVAGTDARRWRATLTRRVAGADKDDRYQLRFDGSGSIQLAQVRDDGASGRIIEFDDARVSQRRGDGGAESQSLSDVERMIYTARYVAHCRLPAVIDDARLEGVVHVGGNVLYTADGAAGIEPRLPGVEFEVIRWPLKCGATAHFGFDRDSHLLRVAELRDVVSGNEVMILWSDYVERDGVLKPRTIDVRSEHLSYRDSLTNWEALP